MIRIENKIKKMFLILSLCTFLRAEIVITEFLLDATEGSQIPQYIELFNSSDTLVSLLDWSIETWLISTEGDDAFKLTNSASTKFNSSNSNAWYSGSNDGLINENLIIQPNGYFLISSNYVGGTGFFNGNNSNIEVKFVFLEIGSVDSYFGEIEGGRIIILNNSLDEVDRVEFDINSGWDLNINNVGRSFRLHSPNLDNMDFQNWSLSPITENSLWLYENGNIISNFGSPNEENSFRLFDIRYTDIWFDDTLYASGSIHNIYGDYNNYYRAEPYVDINNNGIWDNNEEYHDRNENNFWDYQDNNYQVPFHFSWYGTFIDTTVQDTPNLKYEIIINKNDNVILNSSFGNLGTEVSIFPSDLLIDSLGLNREIANYTWEVQLTKTFENDSIDVIYSDRYNFSIDASDYGKYGCVDNGLCDGNGNCPTSSYFENSYTSIHPIGCTPNVNCFSAINYYSDANINSNNCHYVSLSLPAFTEGNNSTNTPLPIYLYNDSSAVFDSIFYSITVSDTSIIDSFYSSNISIPNIVKPTIDLDSTYQIGDSIFVIISYRSNPSFNGKGIINYINFDLSDTSASTDLLFQSAIVKGGDPLNNISNSISIPFVNGDLVISQDHYRLDGRIVYYSGIDPFEIPNVELSLEKKYDGVNTNSMYRDTTNQFGYYNFESLTEGHYTLSFNKDSQFDSNCSAESINYYVNGWDVASIAQHITGTNPLSELGQLISADVTLDGTITGLDASLVAQYTIDLIDELNGANTHWIFKPSADSTLSSIYAELLTYNGEYSIEYSPLVFDDENRDIYAHRLGDVNGNYCSETKNGREQNLSDYVIKNIRLSHQSKLVISIVISEPIYVSGMYFEIGYDNKIFRPQSFTFESTMQILEDFESMSNLHANNGSIKAIAWTPKKSQLLEGVIAEIVFDWVDEYNSGSIWLQNSVINDLPGNSGIILSGNNADGFSNELNIINISTPSNLYLEQNFPNPFNPSTKISWFMPAPGYVSIEIYDLMGKLIDIPFDGYKSNGKHEIIWDAYQYPSGIYISHLKHGKINLKKKMILIK